MSVLPEESAEPSRAPSEAPDRMVETLRDMLPSSLGIRSLSLTVLTVLAVVGALRFARAFLVPLAVAFVLSFLLAPVVTLQKRMRIPQSVGAFLVLAGLLGTVGVGFWMLAEPATVWLDRLPQTLRRVEREMRQIEQPIAELTKATRRIDELREIGGDKTPVMKLRDQTVNDVLMKHVRALTLNGLIVVILLYFLLASGDRFLEKAVRLQSSLSDKKRFLGLVREIQSNVSTYLLTITWINALLGLAVGSAMYFLDMPSPVLWGVMAALLNYVPFVGAAVGIAVVTLGAIATFDGLGQVALIPLTYLVLTTMEAYLLTPIVLGRRLMLSPVVIFIGVLLWSWLWGIPGALLAVPLLAILKIVCDSVEPLHPLGELMSR